MNSVLLPIRRRLRAHGRVFLAATLILPTLLAGSVGGTAHAAPGDPVPTDGAGVTMAWPSLGLANEVFLGPNSSTSFSVPVPLGLNASRLTGTFRMPMNIGAGFLEIDDGAGRLLGSVDLPAAGSAAVVTPFDVDLSAARVQASAVDVSFTVRPVDNANQYCGPLQQLTLTDLATVFTGVEPPATTIASFLPPVLQQATIYTPTDADSAEQQSVLTLVATLARLYQPQPLRTTVVQQRRGATPPPSPPLARAIVVETGDAGLSVENPGEPGAYLRVSGHGDELTTQVSLLINELQSLAQVASVRVDQAGSETSPTGDTFTFGQLKLNGKADVLRTSNFSIGVDRATLGGPRVDGVSVHLRADYTPVPRDDAAAVMIRSGGAVVYRASLDATGVLDATFDLDATTLGQGINLDFALTYTPHEACGPLMAPITFQVNPQSTMTLHRGGPPLGGFSGLPSEFSPAFVVALDGSSPNQLGYAARIVDEVARLTGKQLMPQVVDVKTAADATTGALIIANSEAVSTTTLNPPISADGTAIDVALPNALRADVKNGLGSIQAFADPTRNRSVVLVTTTGPWTLVDPLFTYLDGLGGGWSQLNGDVLAAGAAGTPTNVAIRTGDAAADAAAPAGESTADGHVWTTVAVAAVLALAVLGGVIFWMRRRRNT
ncbi:hypothetical protein [Mycolicibacterium sp. P1-18]|uniref:hypothetical protein n=1 Tax=Mycolicibacterium sp. P1-18 TaxID=2024615 RepID=UPI001F5B7AC4|nr:hypothetical protein [Mycolicibacterium sp. P1-18]